MRVLPVLSAWACLGAAAAASLAAGKPGPTTVKSVKATAAADSARIIWDAQETPGISGWAIDSLSFCGVLGRSVAQQVYLKPGTREYVLKGLAPGRMYAVRVYPYLFDRSRKRVSRAPVSGRAPSVDVRVGSPGGAKPAAPKNVAAVADGARVWLTWSPNEERDVAGYEILRKGPGETEPAPRAKLLVNQIVPVLVTDGPGRRPAQGVADFFDAGLEEGKAYEYLVRAFTAGQPPQYSEPSKPVAVKAVPYEFRSDDLLFVVNTEAKSARQIALNYARARGITSPKAVKVKLKPGANITRNEFEAKVLAPVQNHLERNPRTTILLLVRGMPWRINESGRNANPRRYYGWDRASVDSELMLARARHSAIEGRIRNPLYGKVVRLTPLDRILAVCRLDGPDDQVADDLVRRALDAEKRGVEGIAFFDARGLTSGGYVMGDRMILKAADIARKDGRLPVKVDNTDKVVDLSSMKEKLGFYYGWYKGSFRPKNKAFRFGRGAVAAHLHSYAGSVIQRDGGWVGELLHHGATAALGVAHEPLLDGFPAPEPLVENLLGGRTFAEAALASCKYLSWMPIAVGDPLYRPFPPRK